MQTEPTPMEVKKPSKFGVVTVFVIIFLLAAIGFGVWGYTLNNDLKTTQASEAALQKKYDTLTKEKNTVSDELDQANADLEQARKDLETAKEDLTSAEASLAKSKEEAAGLQGTIDKVLKYLDVAIGFLVDNDDMDQVDAKVAATEDPELMEKFEDLLDSGSFDDFEDFFIYLFSTINDLLAFKGS